MWNVKYYPTLLFIYITAGVFLCQCARLCSTADSSFDKGTHREEKMINCSDIYTWQSQEIRNNSLILLIGWMSWTILFLVDVAPDILARQRLDERGKEISVRAISCEILWDDYGALTWLCHGYSRIEGICWISWIGAGNFNYLSGNCCRTQWN